MKELIKLLRAVFNNVNQITRRCNETRNLYGEEVEDLRKGYVEVQKEVALLVGNLRSCRQGVRAVSPDCTLTLKVGHVTLDLIRLNLPE